MPRRRSGTLELHAVFRHLQDMNQISTLSSKFSSAGVVLLAFTQAVRHWDPHLMSSFAFTFPDSSQAATHLPQDPMMLLAVFSTFVPIAR